MDWASKRLATGSDDGLVKIWSLDGKPTWESSIDCKHEMTVAVDADFGKKRIVTASWDYNVDLWDLETGPLETYTTLLGGLVDFVCVLLASKVSCSTTSSSHAGV